MKIKVNGIELNYDLQSAAGKPVVVLSHSLGSSMSMWDPQVRALSPSYQLLRFDTRGHGESQAPTGPYDLDMLGDDAVALLDALDLERVHWVGLSMGGMVGQNVALRYPRRLITLSLCDTMALVTEDMQCVWLDRIKVARNAGMEELADATMQRWFTETFRRVHPEAVAPIRGQFVSTPTAGYIGCCEAIRRLNYLQELHTIGCPALVMVGEHDPATPVAASDAMHRRLTSSEMAVIPDAAHMSNIEQADTFNSTLSRFLSTH